ncbi:hypothetical protein [Thalassotalea euphylliae]|uniref:Uncharacterized protein n=1 Tax=Thalassotalea euphylliae TaxID=1655234 RepID=A0A3E0UD69_9GAMM|nr:hypothetical protein [Thalassotalea euphylliae]REL30400.1 hypothetical protein DXX94_06585 [Thalassotalea euphylliae]REL34664.1 hypothetical protein DXX92_04430 [Thalassotalea euphylliae]
MESRSKKLSTEERRHSRATEGELLSNMTMSQKFSVNSLIQYGYHFAFTRGSEHGTLAVLLCGNSVATVDEQGEINTSPGLSLRPYN